MSKQAIIYTRFSPRPDAAECDSGEKQKERCEAYCRQQGHVHNGLWFSDENVSGGVLSRSALTKVIEHLQLVKDGPVPTILIVDSSDRLARDMLVNLTIRQQVADAGAAIEFADGSPDDTTPEGKLFQNILAAFSAYERDRIRFRTKKGLDRKRKNGERTTGKIPIGWQLDPDNPKRLVKHHGELNAIRRMCYLKSRELSSVEIALRLHGFCRGKLWSARTVRKMIAKHAHWACPVTGDLKLEPTHP